MKRPWIQRQWTRSRLRPRYVCYTNSLFRRACLKGGRTLLVFTKFWILASPWRYKSPYPCSLIRAIFWASVSSITISTHSVFLVVAPQRLLGDTKVVCAVATAAPQTQPQSLALWNTVHFRHTFNKLFKSTLSNLLVITRAQCDYLMQEVPWMSPLCQVSEKHTRQGEKSNKEQVVCRAVILSEINLFLPEIN